jgi:hypothetical protein
MSTRAACRRLPALAQAGALLCSLLAASTAFELHGLSRHHREFAATESLEESATHPRSPHHFDRSEELREPACATCALQSQSRGVEPDPAGRIEPAAIHRSELAPSTAPTHSSARSSASPRGPPAG